ncbi:MFS transporter, partial [Brevibacterium salitolerans]
FKTGAFTGAVLINLLSIFSLIGFLFFASQDLQLVHGMRPMQAGLALLPGVLAMIVTGLTAAPLARRIRPGYIIIAGLVSSGAGYATMAFSSGGLSVNAIVLAFALVAAGVGAAETISNDLILSAVPSAKAGAASAISETAYELGTVLGTAILGSILTASYTASLVAPAGLTSAQASAAQETLGGATKVAQDLPADLAEALLASAHAAFDSGVTTTSTIGVALSGAAVVLALIAFRKVKA